MNAARAATAEWFRPPPGVIAVDITLQRTAGHHVNAGAHRCAVRVEYFAQGNGAMTSARSTLRPHARARRTFAASPDVLPRGIAIAQEPSTRRGQQQAAQADPMGRPRTSVPRNRPRVGSAASGRGVLGIGRARIAE